MSSLSSRHPQIEIFRRLAHRQGTSWQEAAACRQVDPELFFPVGPTAAEIQRAKAVCARCPVRDPCLKFAQATRQKYGIWGGYDENERVMLLRQRPESRVASAG